MVRAIVVGRRDPPVPLLATILIRLEGLSAPVLWGQDRQRCEDTAFRFDHISLEAEHWRLLMDWRRRCVVYARKYLDREKRSNIAEKLSLHR